METQQVRIADYLSLVEREPSTQLMVTETTTPPEVIKHYWPPPHCVSLLPDGKRAHTFFLGNRGCVAHLHFDHDPGHVMFYQVFGRKRITLFPVQAAPKLNSVLNHGGVFLEHMGEEERLDFTRWAGGYDFILEPGEALYMPMMIWHHLEYLDTSASVNIRFWQNPYSYWLTHALCPDYRVQYLMSELGDMKRVARSRPWFERMRAAVQQAPSRIEAHRAVGPLLDELCPYAMPPDRPLFLTSNAPLEQHLMAGFVELHKSRGSWPPALQPDPPQT
jgi:hypothetical protein